MLKSLTASLFLILFTGLSLQLHAQCSPVAPPEGTCLGGNGSAYNGVNINSGDTYWYSSTGTFSNGSNINNGGTLRICGNLTLSQINLNGGTIIITTGGTLTINGSGTLNLNNNVTIVNYGTLNLNRDVVLQNANNAIINATTASVLNMGDYKLKITGSNSSSGNILINKGSIYLKELEITSNSNGICLGNQSIIETQNYINTKPNAITVEPGAIAVLHFTGNGQNDALLSPTANLHICKAPSAAFNGNSTVGSATVYTNCTAPQTALPITLERFEAKTTRDFVTLLWETAQEHNNNYFVIEHSTDGIQFEAISPKIEGAGDAKILNRYSWVDYTPAAGINYYRLKQVDFDGTSQYAGIRSATVQGAFSASIFPNPVDQLVTIALSGKEELSQTITITDMTGRPVYSIVSDGQTSVQIDLSAVPAGNYTVTVLSSQAVQTLPLVKR